MSTPQQYDAIIIGSGQAGTPLSTALAAAGMHTALIERKHVGGTCINEGCTPTKTMVASGRVAYLARRAADYGVCTGAIAVSVDLGKVRQRKRDIVDKFRNGSQARIEKAANLELIFGDARFTGASTGPRTIAVRSNDGAQRVLSAKYIFINAGSRVTIVQLRGQLLAGEDPDVAEEVAKIFQQDGIEVLLNTKVIRVRQADGKIRLEVQQQGHATTLTLAGSHLLVATGRVPNSDTLNLAAAGIQTDDRGFIKVNDRLETTASSVYALGDIKGGPAFTHISYDDFRIIRANLLEKKNASTNNRLVPYTVFIDPQLGRVGLTETDARAQKRNIRVAKLAMTSVARALETDETRGFIKAIVDAETNQILGAAVLGIEGGEIMSAIEIAMMGKLPYTALRDGIFAHPTLAESLNNLFTAMDSGK